MYCISISHKKAPAVIREKYAFSKEERASFMKWLLEEQAADGCVMLCTCNRSEVYLSKQDMKKYKGQEDTLRKPAISEENSNQADEDMDGQNGQKRNPEELFLMEMEDRFARFRGIKKSELLPYVNVYMGEQALSHLFRVSGGFESKVLGEDEILRQVKEAFAEAKEANVTDYELNMSFQRAIACAKKIKTDTKLSSTPISVTTLVANQVHQFEKDGMKNVVILGLTGKIGGTIAKNLVCKPNVHILGTVRKHNGTWNMVPEDDSVQVIAYEDRYSYMEEADVIISATASPHYTIREAELKKVLKTKKKRMFIDLAMPRDIDPLIGKMEQISLYNIDFYDTVSEKNSTLKLEEFDRAKLIMEEEMMTAKKDISFHQCYHKIPKWKALFEEKPFEKLVFSMKKNLDYDSFHTVLLALDQLEEWVKDE